MKKDYVYMGVTADIYELPVFVSETSEEAMHILGMKTANNLRSYICRQNKRKFGNEKVKILKVCL